MSDPVAELESIYAAMEARLRASPGWHEPTAEERREAARLINESFAAMGYSSRLDEDDPGPAAA